MDEKELFYYLSNNLTIQTRIENDFGPVQKLYVSLHLQSPKGEIEKISETWGEVLPNSEQKY